MIRRNLMWGGVVMLFVLAVGGLWALYGTHTVTLSEAQVQERINRQINKEFTIQGRARVLVKSVSIKSAEVHIEDAHVNAFIDLEGTLRTGKKFTLTAYAVGVPTYAHGEFYFKPEMMQVQKFAYEGSTPTEIFTRFAKRYVSDDKVRQLIEDKAPKLEEWMTTLAQNAATHSLEKRPVYRPKDDVKGLLMKASLESVSIDQHNIVVTFSLWQLTLSVLLGVCCLIAAIGFMVVMFEYPLLGVTLTLLG